MENLSKNFGLFVFGTLSGASALTIVAIILFAHIVAMLVGETCWFMTQYLHLNFKLQKTEKPLSIYEGEERRKNS